LIANAKFISKAPLTHLNIYNQMVYKTYYH